VSCGSGGSNTEHTLQIQFDLLYSLQISSLIENLMSFVIAWEDNSSAVTSFEL
jgi:hypothetical protein